MTGWPKRTRPLTDQEMAEMVEAVLCQKVTCPSCGEMLEVPGGYDSGARLAVCQMEISPTGTLKPIHMWDGRDGTWWA